ncbi:DedA family protein [Labrys neptuniae]|uniref:DedA family protein n=1 Tax=Labrys neptuniae TaxID=376174 RepID=UPI00288F7814|nr:DedA family protein [Labrys neptuniae]MDT3377539.1 DedA family protein [Labrys neptuniae]
MTIADISQPIIAFVRAHEGWGTLVVLLLAFGESLAFISLLLPATVILLGIGFLIGESGMSLWPFWAAAALGAFLGDWLSYWIGLKLEHRVAHYWPLTRYPDLLPRGHRFFEKWGALGVFFGRFLGPLRASVPLVAGICEMPALSFQLVNAASAVIWAFGVLAPGALGLNWLQTLF